MILIDTADILRVIDTCKNTETEKEHFRQVFLASSDTAIIDEINGKLVIAFDSGESIEIEGIKKKELVLPKRK